MYLLKNLSNCHSHTFEIMSSRTKQHLVFSFFLLVAIYSACCQESKYQYYGQQRKPNIVFIMADDLGKIQ